jgi:hypothetical protein
MQKKDGKETENRDSLAVVSSAYNASIPEAHVQNDTEFTLELDYAHPDLYLFYRVAGLSAKFSWVAFGPSIKQEKPAVSMLLAPGASFFASELYAPNSPGIKLVHNTKYPPC